MDGNFDMLCQNCLLGPLSAPVGGGSVGGLAGASAPLDGLDLLLLLLGALLLRLGRRGSLHL